MLPKVWHFLFPGCGKARRALRKGCWGMIVNLTCSIHWLLQIQLDLLVSPGFSLLISKGSWSSDFVISHGFSLKRSIAKWWHGPSEQLWWGCDCVRLAGLSNVDIWFHWGGSSWMVVYDSIMVSMIFPWWTPWANGLVFISCGAGGRGDATPIEEGKVCSGGLFITGTVLRYWHFMLSNEESHSHWETAQIRRCVLASN